MSEIPNINISNLEDLESKRCASTRNIDISFNLLIFFFLPNRNTTETSTSSVVIKSIITNISHEKTNGDNKIGTPKTAPEESQF